MIRLRIFSGKLVSGGRRREEYYLDQREQWGDDQSDTGLQGHRRQLVAQGFACTSRSNMPEVEKEDANNRTSSDMDATTCVLVPSCDIEKTRARDWPDGAYLGM